MSDTWNPLFSSGEANRIRFDLRQLKKHGRPFLLLPAQNTAAAITLDLYPAQTSRARIAKSLLRLFVRIGVPIGVKRISVSVPSNDEFVKFLAAQAGLVGDIPPFGVLAGNPANDTQRYIILLFDQSQRPAAAVKAGLSGPAKALIEKERLFLSSVPAHTKGIPKLRSSFEDQRVKAFAMCFVDGESPRSEDLQQLPSVLSSWISLDGPVSPRQTAAWQQLESTPSFSRYPALREIRDRKILATLQHGDFAPWNIKVSPNGAWTVLDWERGDLNGIPSWDWFHYVTQTAILVERKSVEEIAKRIEAVLESDVFKTYSKRCSISGFERELAIAYLVHLIEFIRPAEGLDTNSALLTSLSERWFKGSSSPTPHSVQ